MNTAEVVEDILEHHGVKGMRWGVRREGRVGPQGVVLSDKGKRLKAKGGEGHPAHSDAISSRTIGQVGKKSGTKALSNAELKAFNERLNLEQNFKRLQFEDSSPPRKFVLKLLKQTGSQTSQEVAKQVVSQQVKKRLVTAAVLAA